MSSAPVLSGSRPRVGRARTLHPAQEPLVLCVGLGSVGRRHLRSLEALGHSRFVLYRSGFGTEFPESERHPNERHLSMALAHRPGAVIVSNPTALHVPVALAAARQGCHLFIEKPLSDSLDGIECLAREVQRRGSAVLVGYQLRFHPVLQRIKSWLDDGAIGRVVSAHVHWDEYLPDWHPRGDYRHSYGARRELGDGVLLTLSDPFDYLRWLIGEVARVRAAGSILRGVRLDVEDAAHVTLDFASGALGHVYLDCVEHPPCHTLRIVGREGVVTWDNKDGRALLRAKGGYCEPAFAPHGFSRDSMLRDEMRHFLACIAWSETPCCTLGDGARALAVALAAQRSGDEGRAIDV